MFRSIRQKSRGIRAITVAPITVALSLALTGVVPPGPPDTPVEGKSLRVAAGRAVGPGYRQHVRAQIRPTMLAFDWTGDVEGTIEFRVRKADGWSEWVPSEGNPDEGPDSFSSEQGGRTSSTPVWTGGGVREIEIRVAYGKLRDIRLHEIRSEPPRAVFGESAAAAPSQPHIIVRPEWGADESWRTSAEGCDGNPSYAANVRNAILHHTATSTTYTWEEAPAVIRGIYYHHTQNNGWCDIGYNFLIDKFGRIFEGRYGGIDRAVIGAHAGGFNTGSTGVAVLGNHDLAPTSGAVGVSIRAFLAWKLAYHGVDPHGQVTVTSGGSSKYSAGTVVTLWTISGHRDVSLTACPGSNLYPHLPGIRIDVQKEVMNSPPYPLPGWVRQSNSPALLSVDGFGGLHPLGGQTAVAHYGFWPGWSIVKGAVHFGSGGYAVDAYGGLHKFGDVPDRSGSAYWGWDIARGLAKGPLDDSGYVLDGFGALHPFGGAPSVPIGAYWPGWDIARAVAINSSGTGGYILDGFGGLHPFGTAVDVNFPGYWGGWDIARAVALMPDGKSGYVMDGWGGIHSFGGAPAVQSPHYAPGQDIARGLVLNAAGDGGWMMTKDGVVWAFGNTPALKHSMTWTKMGIGVALIIEH